jgi:prepilin-type N-terminal cleavage/methylation domain-containing protein
VRRGLRRVAGFSLLEALIALAIAAVCLAPIFDLLHQLVDGQRRHEQTLQRAQIERNALVLLRDVNPTATPQGQVQLAPDLTVSWQATAIGDAKINSGFPAPAQPPGRGGAPAPVTGAGGNYTVQLYRLDTTVMRGSTPVVPSFSVEHLGWQLPDVASLPTPTAPASGARVG